MKAKPIKRIKPPKLVPAWRVEFRRGRTGIIIDITHTHSPKGPTYTLDRISYLIPESFLSGWCGGETEIVIKNASAQ